MAHHEHSEDQSQPIEISLTPDAEEAQPKEPLNITIVPDADIGVAFNQEADGGYTIFSRGAIENGGRIVQGEVAIRIPSPVTETSVQDEMPQRGIRVPTPVPEAVTEQTSGPTEEPKKESGNEKFIFVGNVVNQPRHWTRDDGKRVAFFVLATNPSDDDPGHRRIRAFDDTADKVRDHLQKGQKEVEAHVYGPKHWKQGQRTITGYYAGFVKVPKDSGKGEAQG